jgi:hypothetical protein
MAVIGLQGRGIIGACRAAGLSHRSPGRHADQSHDAGVGAAVDDARSKCIGERCQPLLEQRPQPRELRLIEAIGPSDQHNHRSGAT